MKILLVDDCADILNLLASFLELSDHETDKALNGVEALELLHKNVYDVVITDSEMPRMDGQALCKFIKAELPDLYIIGISGSSEALDKLSAAGADVCFAKPFRIGEIEKAIENRFRRWPHVPIAPVRIDDARLLPGRFAAAACR
jgi:DNA-binding response OmpR family regulator